MNRKKIDRPFLISVIILVVAGFFIFTSAALGLLARNGATFASVAFNQIFLGLFLGGIAFIITTKIDYRLWRKYSLPIYIFSIIACVLVFIPHIGFTSGGAKRWISIGPLSLQPAEIYKIGFIIYFAAWLTAVKQGVATFRHGLLPLLILTGITAGLLLAQPDTDTFFIIIFAALSMYIVAGGRFRDLLIIAIIGVIGFGVLYETRPYIRARVETFLHPSNNALTSSYQAQQSQIAIGSGQFLGRGFGQSVQKFNFLPEPIGDSIFAVAAEEFGFVGSVTIILLYLFFSLRALKIAAGTPETFGRLIVVGIVILIISESFINIGAMLGILPLSGTPLLFISHGGTALFFSLAEVGMILNVSKRK
ncbi:MAG: putative peptidoglycan glycosyltransferase FtsW [bacterium]